jgi:hypothetical protein
MGIQGLLLSGDAEVDAAGVLVHQHPAMVALPPGVTSAGDRIRIDLRKLLVALKLEGWLQYVKDLRVTTRAGGVVLDVRGHIGLA